MAVKLSESHLPQLLSWLEQHLPHSFSAHGELKSHLRGQFPDLEFFVDRWPHPQAVVARADPEREQSQSKGSKAQIVDGVFGLTEEAVSGLLKDPRVVAWKSPTMVSAMTNSLKPVALAVAQEMGKSVTLMHITLLKATPQDLKPLPVPEGMRIQPISDEEVKAIHSNWRFSDWVPETRLRQYIQQHPSLCLVTDSGQHVGHMIGTSCGTLGMLHVNPEFRGKGYGKVIVSQLAQKYFDAGDDVSVHIDVENAVSQNLHRTLGFKAEMELFWIWCD